MLPSTLCCCQSELQLALTKTGVWLCFLAVLLRQIIRLANPASPEKAEVPNSRLSVLNTCEIRFTIVFTSARHGLCIGTCSCRSPTSKDERNQSSFIERFHGMFSCCFVVCGFRRCGQGSSRPLYYRCTPKQFLTLFAKFFLSFFHVLCFYTTSSSSSRPLKPS